jgi:cytochrome c5
VKHLIFGAVGAALIVVSTAAHAGEGQAVYDKRCAMCHNKMPPKIGDKAAWAPRIKTGVDALTASSIKGKGKMPPQVGKTGLTPAQVRAAVEYMVSRSK